MNDTRSTPEAATAVAEPASLEQWQRAAMTYADTDAACRRHEYWSDAYDSKLIELAVAAERCKRIRAVARLEAQLDLARRDLAAARAELRRAGG